MSAVLLAVFGQYGDADRVRTKLVSDGFPTDRVELTSSAEPGRAGVQPRTSGLRCSGQFHTIGREAVGDQLGPHALCIPVLAEHRE